MHKNATLNSLDKKIDKVSGTVETLSGTVEALSGTVEALSGTVEALAGSVKRGFDETASKDDLKEVKEELERSIHRVENLLVGGLTNRIEDLEDDVRVLKTRAGIR